MWVMRCCAAVISKFLKIKQELFDHHQETFRFVLPLLFSSMSNTIIIINAYDNMLYCKTTSMGSKCHNTKYKWGAIWEDNSLID